MLGHTIVMLKPHTTIQTRRLPRSVGAAAVQYFRSHGVSRQSVEAFVRTSPIRLEGCLVTTQDDVMVQLARYVYRA